MSVAKFIKDPDAVLDYKMRWAPWLKGDTISGSLWTVPDGITKDSDEFDDSTATVWLSGGTVGESYDVVNRITTAGGRTDDRTISVKIRER